MASELQNRVIQLFGEVSLALIELENQLLDAGDTTRIPHPLNERIEEKVRDIRYLSNILGAVHAEEADYFFSNKLSEIGVKARIGEDYLEIELPYEVITMSVKFRLLSKKMPIKAGYSNINRHWRTLMRQVIREINGLPFEAPLSFADVSVIVLMPNTSERDPDHFWFRPILDSLVAGQLLEDDYTKNVNLKFFYKVDKENPGVIIQVRQGSESEFPVIRVAPLDPNLT
ncbi:hypothetical protein [Alicyclobacillus fodiniaquatilis]|uniref:Uncharacterized protein n=1 Tax=Alicyclobacillus fodiniaquatilis TaxID=1661150 RepID=A0ABW4JHF3_9BACL